MAASVTNPWPPDVGDYLRRDLQIELPLRVDDHGRGGPMVTAPAGIAYAREVPRPAMPAPWWREPWVAMAAGIVFELEPWTLGRALTDPMVLLLERAGGGSHGAPLYDLIATPSGVGMPKPVLLRPDRQAVAVSCPRDVTVRADVHADPRTPVASVLVVRLALWGRRVSVEYAAELGASLEDALVWHRQSIQDRS